MRLLMSNLKVPAASFESRRFFADRVSDSEEFDDESEVDVDDRRSLDECFFDRFFLLRLGSSDEVDDVAVVVAGDWRRARLTLRERRPALERWADGFRVSVDVEREAERWRRRFVACRRRAARSA